MDAYFIFEGGGAKGLGHVGAYAFLYHQGIRCKGIAATSAGSIVAALIAAGYEPEQLYHIENGMETGIFGFDGYVSTFGFKRGWRLVKFLRFTQCLPKWKILAPIRLLLYTVWATWFAIRVFRKNGMLSTRKLQYWLDDRLKEGINRRRRASGQPEISRSIYFSDLIYPLNIVATNLSRREIVVFGADSSQASDLAVAAAVAASVAIPLIFEPVKLPNNPDLFVDGGVTSNFPIWMFESLREWFGKKVPVIGVSLLDIAVDEKPGGRIEAYFRNLFASAISGTQKVERTRVGNLGLIQVESAVSTIDFDMGAQKREELFETGWCAARRVLTGTPQLKDHAKMTELLDLVRSEIAEKLGAPSHLRVNVALPISSTDVMVYFMSSNMADDTDDCLVFAKDEGAIGACFESKRPVCVDLGDPDNRAPGAWRLDKYQQALVRSELRALLSVPVLQPKAQSEGAALSDYEVIGVLNIDSDLPLYHNFREDRFQEWCFDLAQSLIRPAFVLPVDEL